MNRSLSPVGTSPPVSPVAVPAEDDTTSGPAQQEDRSASALLRPAVTPVPPAAGALTPVPPAAGASMVVPGARVAYWSDALLELVLRYLGAADLGRCGQTCRRWYQAASDPRLRTRAFIRTFPQWYRASLDADLVRAGWSRWCNSLAADARLRLEQQSLCEPGLPPRVAFYALAQQLVNTGRFAVPDSTPLWCAGALVEAIQWSPDGRYLALWTTGVRDCLFAYAHFWRLGPAGLYQVGASRYLGGLASLRFRADGRGALALGGHREVLEWRLRSDTGKGALWCITGRAVHPLGTPARWATLSPDGLYLALFLQSRVSVFSKAPDGDWQLQCQWACRRGRVSWAIAEVHSVMVFSARSQHLFFVDGQGLRAFHRTGERWQECALEADHAGEPVTCANPWDLYYFALDPGEQMLAVVRSGQGREAVFPATASRSLLGVWRFAGGRGWQSVARHHRPRLNLYDGQIAMAFSPDGCHLAFGEKNPGYRKLHLLSASDRDDWSVSIRLRLGPLAASSRFEGYVPISVQFSSTGVYLAATAYQGIGIWRRHQPVDPGWLPVMWTGVEPGAYDCQAAFSPDGFHCALLTAGCRISVWGPQGGRYREKLAWCEELPVTHLAFTPDAAGLVVVCCDAINPANRAKGLSLRYLPLVAATPDAREQEAQTDSGALPLQQAPASGSPAAAGEPESVSRSQPAAEPPPAAELPPAAEAHQAADSQPPDTLSEFPPALLSTLLDLSDSELEALSESDKDELMEMSGLDALPPGFRLTGAARLRPERPDPLEWPDISEWPDP